MFILAGIIAGILLSMQTAANARLRSFVTSPFMSACISCTVSFLLVLLLLCVRSAGGGMAPPQFEGTVWWMYLGGVFGVAVLVGCIVLFPLLGAVQTTVLPIFGQILLGILADTFGWFGSKREPFSALSLAGVGILVAGIVFVVILPDIRKKGDGNTAVPQRRKWFWQAFAVLIGMSSASQAAVNGKLGASLGSALYASVFSIATVVILTLFINIQGGAFGVGFILLNTAAVPVIGTGTLMVFSVAGQLTCSVLIQHFGWFYSQKKKIQSVQIVGLLLMLAGVVIVKIL